MAVINKTGITNGGTVQAEHVTRAIDALSGVSTDTIIATGSFSGSLTGTATSASLATTTAGVNLTDTTTGTGPYYPVFSLTNASAAILRTDTSTFTYNATTNNLTVTASYANQALSSSIAQTASLAQKIGTSAAQGEGAVYINPNYSPGQIQLVINISGAAFEFIGNEI